MAKKKRKKPRRPVAPSGSGGTSTVVDEEASAESSEKAPPRRRGASAPAVSNRQARKEAARRERERRIKAARRRARLRRAARWGAVLAVAGGVAAVVWFQTGQSRRIQEAAAEAAQTLGCTDVRDTGEGARGHYVPGEQPTPYAEQPATAGKHSPGTYAGPPVITGPVSLDLEVQLVHNLEHGYVLMYYSPQGDARLPDAVRSTLADLAESEDKVLLAPHPGLADGQSLSLVAWTKVQGCSDVGEGEADAATALAEGFIDRFRGGGDAPEPGGV